MQGKIMAAYSSCPSALQCSRVRYRSVRLHSLQELERTQAQSRCGAGGSTAGRTSGRWEPIPDVVNYARSPVPRAEIVKGLRMRVAVCESQKTGKQVPLNMESVAALREGLGRARKGS